MQFRQETKTNWIHAYQSVGYLTAGTTYQISIMTTDSSHNLKLGLGMEEPKEGVEYLGSAKVEGGYNASIDNGKEYVINVVPSTDGPHYIVISDGAPPGQISKVNNVSMLKATP